MWWGGGGGPPDPGPGSGASPGAPQDHGEEEQEEGLPHEETPRRARSPSLSSAANEDEGLPELRDLREQFAAQESLLGHLRGVLKSNEEKLLHKEAVVEGYALRLGKMRPRKMLSSSSSPMSASWCYDTRSESSLDCTRPSSTSPSLDPHLPSRKFSSTSMAASEALGPSGTPSSNPSDFYPPPGTSLHPATTKMSLLRQQLQEARAKEEEESKGRKTLENLVLQLQKELEDRDKVISTMKEDMMSVVSFNTTSPFVMSPEGGPSPDTLSPCRTPPYGRSVDSFASSFGPYGTFNSKDERILELNEQIILLERRILDLEENLKEKDELISARTKAVTLMSADLNAKGKSTLDQLQDTRDEMRKMQARFAEQEMSWKQENSDLALEVQSKQRQLDESDSAVKNLEKIRFNLSTKNAALQEKIVALQEAALASRSEFLDSEAKFEEKERELCSTINGLERQLEAEKKVKSERREKFIKDLKDVVEDDLKVLKTLELEDKITELEEEKGCLQLRLVDLEEITVTDAALRDELKLLSEKVRSQESKIEEHLQQINRLESEKAELVEDFQAKDQEMLSGMERVSELVAQNDDLVRAKVKLELRAVELEEQKDRWEEERLDLKALVDTLKKNIEGHTESKKALESLKEGAEAELEKLKVTHGECEERHRLSDREIIYKSDKIHELTVAKSELEKMLEAKTSCIAESLIQVRDAEAQVKLLTSQLEAAQGEIGVKSEEICRLSSLLDENQLHHNLEEAKETVRSLEEKLQRHMNDILAKDEQIEELQLQIDDLKDQVENANLSNKAQISYHTEEMQKLQGATALQLAEIQAESDRQVAELDATIARQLKDITNYSMTIDSTQKRLEIVQEEIETIRSQNTDLEVSCEQLKSERDVMRDQLKSKNDELTANAGILSSLEEQNATLSAELSKSNDEWRRTTSKAKEESDGILSQLQSTIENRNLRVEELEIERDSLMARLEKITERTAILEKEIESASVEVTMKSEEIKKLSSHLKEEQNITTSNKDEELKAKDMVINELKAERDSLANELKWMAERVSSYPEWEHYVKTEAQPTTTGLRENNASEISSTEGQEAKKESDRIVFLQGCIDAEGLRVNELEAERDTLATQLEKMAEHVSRLQEDLEATRQEAAEKLMKIDALTSDKEESLKIIPSLSAENEDLKAKLSGLERNCSTLQRNYDQLVASVDGKFGDLNSDLIAERDKAVKKSDLLTEKCRKLLAKCRQQETQLKDNDAALEGALAKANQSEADLQDAKSGLTERLKTIEAKDDEIAGLQEELETYRNELSSLKDDLTMKLEEEAIIENQMLTEMQQKIDSLESCYEALSLDKDACESTIVDLQERLERAESKCLEQTELVAKLKEDEQSRLKKTGSESKDADPSYPAITSGVEPGFQNEEEFQGFGDTANEGWDENEISIESEIDQDSRSVPEDKQLALESLKSEDRVEGSGWDEEEIVLDLGKDEDQQGQLEHELKEPEQPQSLLSIRTEEGWRDDMWGDDDQEHHLAEHLRLSEVRTEEEERSKDIQDEKDAQIKLLQEELTSVKDKVLEMEEKLLMTKDVEARDAAAAELLSKLGEELKASESRVETLSKTRRAQDDQLLSTQLSQSTCMERLDISSKMIEDYMKRIDELNDEQRSLQLELVSSYEELEELRPLRKVKEELENALDKMESFEDFKEEWQSEISKLEDALELAKTELKSVNEQLDAADKERQELREKAERLANNAESAKEGLDVARREAEEAREAIARLEASSSTAEQETEHRLAEFQAEIAERDRAVAETKRQLEESEDRIWKLEQNLFDLKGTNKMLEDNLDSVNGQRLELENELAHARGSMESSREALRLKEAELEASREQLDILQAQLLQQQQQQFNLLQQQQQLEEHEHHNNEEGAAENRPPPDVTNRAQSSRHPDIANHETQRRSPDLMPFFSNFGGSLGPENFDLVQQEHLEPVAEVQQQVQLQQGVAADWFDNLQPVVEHELHADGAVIQNVQVPAAEGPLNDPGHEEAESLRARVVALSARVDEAEADVAAKVEELFYIRRLMEEHEARNSDLISQLAEVTQEKESIAQMLAALKDPKVQQQQRPSAIVPVDTPHQPAVNEPRPEEVLQMGNNDEASSPLQPIKVFSWDDEAFSVDNNNKSGGKAFEDLAFAGPSSSSVSVPAFGTFGTSTCDNTDVSELQLKLSSSREQIDDLKQQIAIREEAALAMSAAMTREQEGAAAALADLQKQVEEQSQRYEALILEKDSLLAKLKVAEDGASRLLEETQNSLLSKEQLIADKCQVIVELEDKVQSLISKAMAAAERDGNEEVANHQKNNQVQEQEEQPAPPPAIRYFTSSVADDISGGGHTDIAEVSSYFAQGPAPNDDDELAISASSVFDNDCQPQQTQPASEDNSLLNEQITWYKSELERYQQAIGDWQSWSEAKSEEVAVLNQSLTNVTEAYNASVVEIGRLAAAAASAVDDGDDEEATKYLAQIKTKDIEIRDLTETVDRLKSEKEELEAEVAESNKANHELRSMAAGSSMVDEDRVEMYVYEEAKAQLEAAEGRCKHLALEVASIREERQRLKDRVSEDMEVVQRLKSELLALESSHRQLVELRDSGRLEVERLQHEVEKGLADLRAELALHEETKGHLEESEGRCSRLSLEVASMGEEQVRLKDRISADAEVVQKLQSDLLALESSNRQLVELRDAVQFEVERLQSDLAQERRRDTEMSVELSVLEETRTLLADAEDRCQRLAEEVGSLQEERHRLMDRLAEGQQESSQVLRSSQMVAESGHDDLLAAADYFDSKLPGAEEEQPSSSAANDQNELEALKMELATSQAYLLDWQKWGEARTAEYETLTQSCSQQAEEVRALKETNSDLAEKVEKLQELLEVREEELRHLKSSDNDDRENRAKATSEVQGGWADDAEDDFLVQSAASACITSGQQDEAILQLEAEISDLKHRLKDAVDAKASMAEEVNAAKVKQGRLSLKVKTLTKELEAAKGSRKGTKADEGDFLEAALVQELNQRVEKAEKDFKEASQRLKDSVAENRKLLERIDTLEAGNDRFLELKEQQDNQVQLLLANQSDLRAKCDSMEWQFSEMEQQYRSEIESLARRLEEATTAGPAAAIGGGSPAPSGSCSEPASAPEELKLKLGGLEAERDVLKAQVALANDLADRWKLDRDRAVEECESLKLLLDQTAVKEKLLVVSDPAASSVAEEYQDFQVLNHTLQAEIVRLKAYIDDQHRTQDDLRRQLLQGGSDATRERHESTATSIASDRGADSSAFEVRRLLLDPEEATDPELKAERLQLELDQSLQENRKLSRQMKMWKDQLAADAVASEGDGGGDGDYCEDDSALLRFKQDQAYRSVGALQLRVEELTLEVTKLLEERDTLQLRLSNAMRQLERHKESSSRASTACSTPVPWLKNPSAFEVAELKHKIEELGKLNYALDVELQKERDSRRQMQENLRLHHHRQHPRQALQASPPSSGTPSKNGSGSPGSVIHL